MARGRIEAAAARAPARAPRRRKAPAGLVLALLLLMVAPPWLEVAAQAPPLAPAAPATPGGSVLPGDPVGPFLERLGRLLGEGQGLRDDLAPGEALGRPQPRPDAALGLGQRLAAEAGNETTPVLRGPIQPLLEESFEEPATLLDRGWSQEVLRGTPPWGVADAANATVLRLDGAAFEVTSDTGEAVLPVKHGRRAAGLVNAEGRYDPRIDARLVSPVLDLRYVAGASARTDEAHDLLTKDPAASAAYREFLAFWHLTLGPRYHEVLHSQSLHTAYGWLLTTPPSKIQRLYLGPLHDPFGLCGEAGLAFAAVQNRLVVDPGVGCPVGDSVVNPLRPRYGAGLVNLTFYSDFAFSDHVGEDAVQGPGVLADTMLDGGFLEVRVVDAQGRPGPWEYFLGDAAFEPRLQSDRGVARSVNNPLDLARPSGLAEAAQGVVDGQVQSRTTTSYNGRVQLANQASCLGTATRRVDCEPDVPAFVRESGSLVKHHFTLNAYVGHRIQVAWRAHSGAGSVEENKTGWFLDAVRVEALLPGRDAAVDDVTQPRAGDVVPAAPLQPEAVLRNHGWLPLEDARVTFTVEEQLRPAAPEELLDAAAADGDAAARALAGSPPAPPGVPAATLGALPDPDPPRVVFQASLRVPRLEPLQALAVRSPSACTACGPGHYVLRVEVQAEPAGGDVQALPVHGVEDGTRSNNALAVPFEVRDVAAAEVRLHVPPSAVMTDLEEAKTLLVEVANTGNLALEGVLSLTAQPLDPRTLAPVPGAPVVPVERRSLAAEDLPAGRRFTSLGAADDTWEGEVPWTPRALPPGPYRVTARFESPALPEAATDRTDAFVRATPTPYLPGDGRPAEDFERSGAPLGAWSPDRLPSRNLTSLGWRCSDPCSDYLPLPLPKGPVSTPNTWNATGSDGPLLELSVLALFAGRDQGAGATTPGLPSEWPQALPQQGVRDRLPAYPPLLAAASAGLSASAGANDTGFRVCVAPKAFAASPAQCADHPQLTRYDALENLTAMSVAAYQGHSFVNDYYLARPLDLRDCGPGCRPVLTFWHTSGFAWEAGPGEALPALPGGSTGPAAPPGAVRSVGAQQAAENRSRGAVEVVPLDGGPPLRAEVLPGGVPGPCAAADAACPALRAAPCPPAPAPCAPAPPPEAVAQPVVLREWRTAVPEWTEETLDLRAFAGRQVALVFHFQTSLGRLNVNQTRLNCYPPPLAQNQQPGPGNSALCLGSPLDHWTLDNVRLHGTGASGPLQASFVDGAGDHLDDTAHRDWSRFRLLREVAEANLALAPRCFEALRGGADTACLTESRFTGPAVAVDGRGWDRFTHLAQRQRNGRPNPHYDGWFIDDTFGFLPPGGEPGTTGHSLRWGGPGEGGQHPALTAYTLASTAPVDLSRAAWPRATFEANYSFSRADFVLGDESAARDGAAVFLVRHAPEASCAGRPECPLALDRRVLLVPEEGYTGKVKGTLEAVDGIGPRWDLPPSAPRNAANAFAGRSGEDPRHATWTTYHLDLLQGFGDLCLKEVVLGATSFVRSFDPDACRGLGLLLTWEEGRGLDRVTGALYRNLTAFAHDRHARYALEFHAQDHEPYQGDPLPGAVQTQDFGLALDDLRLGERALANDVGIAGFEQPVPQREVGPGEEVQVRVRLRNHGHFDQRGVTVHYNVTQHGVQVFPDPGPDPADPVRSVAFRTPSSLLVPGLRGGAVERDVTVAFDRPWVPSAPGLYTLRAWTELPSLDVGDLRVPLRDENPRNDLFAQEVEVVAVHHVRLVPPADFPDAKVVEPLVGSAADVRALRVEVENLGTVAQGLAAGPGRALRVELRITDEVGREVLRRELAVDHLAPGRRLLADFGPRAWQPPGGGVFTLTFRAVAEQDLSPEDDLRVLRVLVLAALLPEASEAWTGHFEPQDPAWQGEARRHFRSGEGWSFGRGDLYPPRANASLLLAEPLDLGGYRNALMTLRHAYDFEEGYDGGLVEVSVDGTRWEALAPLATVDEEGALLYQGYPAALTSASPEVADPTRPVHAFTGRSDGLVTSVFRLGTADLTRSEPVALLEDDFDRSPHLQGLTVEGTLGQWREIVDRTEVPRGKAWWANGSLVWRPGLFLLPTASPAVEDVTLEGSKDLVLGADGSLLLPALDAPLVVEFDEWRALGLSARNGVVLQHGFATPTSVEVALERLGPEGTVLQRLPVVAPDATVAEPYGDNYRGWTRRSVLLPGGELVPFLGQPVRLVFRLNLANSNDGVLDLPSNLAPGTGTAQDTDLLSPNLGWAIAAPRVWVAVGKPACDAAGLRFQGGRCLVVEDLLDYADADDPAVRARWSAAWKVENFSRAQAFPDLVQALPGEGRSDAFGEAGWRLVDAVGVLHDAPVWDAAAPGPARSGKGLVAEAKGSGVSSRLVTPLDLRAATSDVTLTLDHSFKFTDLAALLSSPPMRLRGAASGGVVAVSRDGGHSWEPLAPLVDTPVLGNGERDKAAYTQRLREEGFRPVYQRGAPALEFQCTRPTHRGCLDPADPIRSAEPGHDGQVFRPLAGASAHTALGGRDGDPEANSDFGLGGIAFTGSTCQAVAGEDWRDPCSGPEDWRRVRFDLTPYAGSEVLVGFHAAFTTHRYTRDAHVACPLPGADCTALPVGDDEVLVPRDFWRVDAVRVEGRVLEGQDTWVRFRAVTDDENEAYGWDLRNVTVLGDRHVRNLAVHVASPAEGAPVVGGNVSASARLENRGETPLRARGALTLHQAGAPRLLNGGFEELRQVNLTTATWTLHPANWTLTPDAAANRTLHAVDGASAMRLVAGGGSDAPFALVQQVRVPPGRWRLVGFADADEPAPGTTAGAGVTVVGASALDGEPDPTLRFPSRASGGTEPSNLTWQAFALPFVVEGQEAKVQVRVHADRDAAAALAPFAGTLRLDHLRLEPDPVPAPATPLRNGGFEEDLEGWTVLGGQVRTSGVFNRFLATFPTAEGKQPTQQQEVLGDGVALFQVPVPVANLTWVNVTVDVQADPGDAPVSARPADDLLEVVVTAPDGQVATATGTLRAGARVAVPVVPLPVSVAGRREVGGPVDMPSSQRAVLPLPRAFDPPPEAQLLNATSAPEALAQVAHLDRSEGQGTWQVRVAVRTAQPALAPVHVEGHLVRVDVTTVAYAARVEPVAAGLQSLPEGRRALVVASTGHAAADAGVEQVVSLAPGRYRLDGVLLTRGLNWSLTRDEDGTYLALASGQQVEQRVRAEDLPRHLRTITLFVDGLDVINPLDLTLLDDHGTVLAQNRNVPRQNGILAVPLDVLVPQGPEFLTLRLKANEALRVQVRPEAEGDDYPAGTLTGAAVGAAADLRAVFQGPVETVGAQQGLAVAGGAGTADPAASSDLPLPASVEHHLRQVVDLRGLEARRVEGVRLRVVLPAAPEGTVRQGELRAQLFDLQGRALSDEASWSHTQRTPLLPALATFADFTFTDALLPAGTERVVLGLRAVNFTDDRDRGGADRRVRLTTVPAPDDPATGVHLRGQRVVAHSGCDAAAPEVPGVAPRGCMLPLNVTVARAGSVVLEAAGAQAAPLRLDQPLVAPETLAPGVRHGGVPFALDFDVPAGVGEVTLRLRARGWQGDLLLDALALRPLTPPAAPFLTAVPRGGDVLVLGGSAAPRFPTVRGASYEVRAEAVALDEEGRPLSERVLGDNRASLRTGPAAGPGHLVVQEVRAAPNNLDLALGQELRLVAVLRNEGGSPASLADLDGDLRPRGGGAAVWEGDQAELVPLPEDLLFAPFEAREVGWTFLPPATLGHGLYTFGVTVSTVANGTNAAADPHRATVDLYLGSNVHRQYASEWPFSNNSQVDDLDYLPRAEGTQYVDRWTSDGLWNPLYPPENICNDPNRPGVGGPADTCVGDRPDPQSVSTIKNWKWSKTDDFNLSAYRSITLGGAAELQWELCCQGQGLSEGTIFTVARAPAANLTGMPRPQLLYADRHQFNGPDPDGTIVARLLRPLGTIQGRSGPETEWDTFPGGYCLTDNAQPHWVRIENHIQGASTGFNAGHWVRRNLDLAPLFEAAEAAGVADRGWTHVQVCWLLEQPSPLYGASLIRQWDLDDVQVTPFGMDLGPAQTLPVTDNVTKDYRLRLHNRGAYTDTYELAVEDEAGLPGRVPLHWRLALLDAAGAPLRRVQLEPGQSAEVVVRVHIAVAPPTLAREGSFDLPLTVRSLTTDLLRTTQRLHFDYTYPERTNLRVAAVSVNQPHLPPDQPRTVDVLVHNAGVATARGVKLVVLDKMDPAYGVAPVELFPVGGGALPLLDLAPSETRLLTVQWTPRVAGEHNLTAILDPDGLFLEFDERDNQLARPFFVPAPRYPDLRVEASLSDHDPSPGDLVEVHITLTNRGDEPAAGVQVTARAGVADLLPGEPPHLLDHALAPGQTVTLTASWRPAFPGEQALLVRARTAAGVLERVDTSEDNFALLTVRVRGQDLALEAPGEVRVAAGEATQASVVVHNRGEVADAYRLTVEAPDGWRAALEGLDARGRVVLAGQAARPVTLRLEAPARAEAGPHVVVLRATSDNGTAPAEVHLRAMVPQAFGYRVEAGPDAVLPTGVAFLPVVVHHEGNGHEVVTVRARQLPAGWSVDAATLEAGPRARAEALLRVVLPSSTPEGDYPVALEAQGRDGRVVPVPLQVRVLPTERVAVRLSDLPDLPLPGQGFTARVHARNDGNVPVQAALALQGPADWRVALERDVVHLRPGEERSLEVRAVLPADAPARAQPLRVAATTARAAADASAPVRPALADLHLVEVEVRPPGQVAAGSVVTVRAEVRNEGEVPAAPGLGVWLDGALVAYEPGTLLAPGQSARVTAHVRVPAGEHVLLAALDTGGALGEADEANNARVHVVRAASGFPYLTTPDPGPLLLLSAVAALALLRRRARA